MFLGVLCDPKKIKMFGVGDDIQVINFSKKPSEFLALPHRQRLQQFVLRSPRYFNHRIVFQHHKIPVLSRKTFDEIEINDMRIMTTKKLPG